MKCFYHNDMDGKCAGAIVNKYYTEAYGALSKQVTSGAIPVCKEIEGINPDPCECISISYKDDFPFDTIRKNELIVIVDFSLQKEGEFDKLLEITENVIWIDHHKSAIDKHKKHDANLKGIRRDGVAGCVLTWEYFYKDLKIPTVVKLLGDYDIWAFKFGDATKYLQTGIRVHKTDPKAEGWLRWLSSSYHPEAEFRDGEVTTQYRDGQHAGLIKAWSFFTEFEGYKVIACNVGSASSQLFDSVKGDYDLMMPFCFDGKQWTVSIYTKKDIDCSALAAKYGGGGHKSAAGFQCKELQIKR